MRGAITRGAAHFLRETVGRVSYCGARGQLTVRADSGFYTHAVVAVCRRMDVRFSIAIRQRARLRNLIEAIPEDAWTPIPYWIDGAADVAETTYTPFQAEADAAPVRLIVRRVKPAPGSQLALFAAYSYHGFITDRDGETLELEADHRRHAEIENAIRDLKYGVGLNHLPSGRFAANGAWLAVQVMAHASQERQLLRLLRRLPPGPGELQGSVRPVMGGDRPKARHERRDPMAVAVRRHPSQLPQPPGLPGPGQRHGTRTPSAHHRGPVRARPNRQTLSGLARRGSHP